MKKTVIINRGIPASGKSSFAREIVRGFAEKGLSALSCSADSYFMVDGEYRFDPSKLREYHIKNQNCFKEALKNSTDLVICDNTNIEPWEANVYYEMAKEYGYYVILMDFEARDMKEHIDAQMNDDYKHQIPQDVIERMLDSYRTYRELTLKSSYPKSYHLKRDYDEASQSVQVVGDISEPFYYDSLIKIVPEEYLKVKEIIAEMILKKMREYDIEEIRLIPEEYRVIMREFHKSPDKVLSAYDLKPLLDKSVKQIERYFESLMADFGNIIEVKKSRKKAYRLIDGFDVFIEAFEKAKKEQELYDLFELAQESNPKLFEKLEYQTTKRNSIYLFKNAIIENIENEDVFKELKNAVKKNEYRDLVIDDWTYKNTKPIRLVFTDNNWYLAYVDDDDKLKLARIAFIHKVLYSQKNSYQKHSVDVHLSRLKTDLQNAMTLFDKEIKTAKLKAIGDIQKYFKKDMKKFLSSQTFVKKEEDGSVIFTVEYTQELEILPFIQKWMPDLIIVEPEELQKAYAEKLQEALQNHTN